MRRVRKSTLHGDTCRISAGTDAPELSVVFSVSFHDWNWSTLRLLECSRNFKWFLCCDRGYQKHSAILSKLFMFPSIFKIKRHSCPRSMNSGIYVRGQLKTLKFEIRSSSGRVIAWTSEFSPVCAYRWQREQNRSRLNALLGAVMLWEGPLLEVAIAQGWD